MSLCCFSSLDSSSSSSSSSSSNTKKSVFDIGCFTTLLLQVGPDSTNPSFPAPPKPLLIATPSEAAGSYPILLFLHGYLLYNSFYSQLIRHIASHGFIVIAPQLYRIAGADTTEEVKSAAAITNWLVVGLQKFLPPNIEPNLNKLGLAGHSRGGKVAFNLALQQQKQALTVSLKFSALIGVDPVDGMDKDKQTPPRILTYAPQSFDLDMAVLVIGSGLGEIRKNPLFPPCAPKGVNHEDFYRECKKPAFYFVVKDYGHLDMLDDDTKGFRGKATYCLCKNGKCREAMRRFVGGAVVAFIRAYMEGDSSELMSIAQKHDVLLPVELQKVDFRV